MEGALPCSLTIVGRFLDPVFAGSKKRSMAARATETDDRAGLCAVCVEFGEADGVVWNSWRVVFRMYAG